MKRAAFTIVYNGLHHLTHNGHAEYLAGMLDYWIIVDGLAGNTGSTSWCKSLEGASSQDGTIQYIKQLQKTHPNIILVETSKKWPSKDAMVNEAIRVLKTKTNKCFLWQIDADEQWTNESMTLAEDALLEQGGKTGMFHSNYFVGNNIMAFGMWGEGIGLPYRRLWLWEGEWFLKHEPPTLLKGNKKEVLLPYRFNHYAYYFDQDVKFKSQYYSEHENVYEGWKKINEGRVRLPCELRHLFGKRNPYNKNTKLRYAG